MGEFGQASLGSPSPWVQSYVGLPYVLGVAECGHRAALVWRERFGLHVSASPAFGDMAAAQNHIQDHLSGGDWLRVSSPLEGDAVIMWKGAHVSHVGVWIAPGYVLHCTRRDGMVLTPEAELEHQGFPVYGYFRHYHQQRLAA
ncbi:hypothetical protein FHG66_16460 [Rubellimicrobium rubrum]|uniref:NlpC/P60 family protein n=1 Tax=Rubellimicrobium rubrum TaxID=2585369 RepID=A0A5C4MUI5_9RHOB|nr:hypothetical protein [Rubellimicrobium rubrum]TNC47473.1 hypothetical protein FHG66_16460 [Rubellimicrobium rubrum]